MDEFDVLVEEFNMESFPRTDYGRVGFINILRKIKVTYDKPLYDRIGETLYSKGVESVEVDILYKMEILVVCPPLGDEDSESVVIIHPVRIYLGGEFSATPLLVTMPELWKQSTKADIRTELDLIFARHNDYIKQIAIDFLIQQAVTDALA